MVLAAALDGALGFSLDGAAIEGSGEGVGSCELLEVVAEAGGGHPEVAEAEAGDDGSVEPDVVEAV